MNVIQSKALGKFRFTAKTRLKSSREIAWVELVIVLVNWDFYIDYELQAPLFGLVIRKDVQTYSFLSQSFGSRKQVEPSRRYFSNTLTYLDNVASFCTPSSVLSLQCNFGPRIVVWDLCSFGNVVVGLCHKR